MGGRFVPLAGAPGADLGAEEGGSPRWAAAGEAPAHGRQTTARAAGAHLLRRSITGRLGTDPRTPGPLDRATATALLARADELLASGEYPAARAAYTRLVGTPDAAITAAALVGAGEALYRLDDEEGARQCWEQAARLPENPSTYRALRQVAAARVRAGDLRGARDAYGEAERRAPAAERAEIASRLGWLNKELGDSRAAGRGSP